MKHERRILGLETELALVFDPAPGESRRPDGLSIYAALTSAVLSRVRALSAKHRKAGHFLENGGFLHYEGRPDIHSQGLLEYSTPECDTARDLSRYARAGESLLAQAIPEAERALASAGFRGTLTLGKNARDSYGNTYGSHENYLASDHLPWTRRIAARGLLLSFLALALPFVVLAILTLLFSVATYYLVYAGILGIGLLSILLVQVIPPLHHRAGPVSLRLDRALERFELAVRDPLWRGYGIFFHYLFLPLARTLSGILRLFVFRDIRSLLPTFLVTRQVFTGAGHVGRAPSEPIFSMSEKAASIKSVARLYWDDARPMIDLKNFVFEAGSVVSDEKRLHVMLSDSNMSEYAEYLKFGTTSLVLKAIEAGAIPKSLRLVSPLPDLHRVAEDPSLTARLRLADGRELTAIEIQRLLLHHCEVHVRGQATVSLQDVEVLRDWRGVLDDLSLDSARAADRVDWVLKRRLVDDALGPDVVLEDLAPWREVVLAAEQVGVELSGDGRDLDRLKALLPPSHYQRLVSTLRSHRLDPSRLKEHADLIYRAKKVDLKYHDITPGRGYYEKAREAGLVRTLFTAEQVEEAVKMPPLHTRAFVRGAFVKRHHRDPKGRVNWTLGKAGKVKVRFTNPYNDYTVS